MSTQQLRYFSMFSGVGGFELGIQRAFNNRPNLRNRNEILQEDSTNTKESQVWPECVGYSEIDKYAIKVYERRFRHEPYCRVAREQERSSSTQRRQETLDSERTRLPQADRDYDNNTDGSHTESNCECKGHINYGDATKINPKELPDFDLLVGGFPCQAFSIAGKRKGFDDTRGTLFFDIARILAEKRPRHLVLENVKGLLSHDSGKTLQTIFGVLSDLGYRIEWQVLNSKDFGVPQNRERIFIVGHLRRECSGKVFPIGQGSRKNLEELTTRASQGNRVYSTDGVSTTIASQAGGLGAKTGLYISRVSRREGVYDVEPRETSGAMTATMYKGIDASGRTGAIDNARIRRLTPLECERLQGFPDNWTEGESDTQRYKMCGNAVTVNVVEAVMRKLLDHAN